MGTPNALRNATFVSGPTLPLAARAARREARWTCGRKPAAKKGRGRGARRAALYDAMAAYRAHFEPLLAAERAAEQAAFAAAARAPPPVVGVRAARRPRLLSSAVFALELPGRGERLPDDCRVAKGDVVYVRECGSAPARRGPDRGAYMAAGEEDVAARDADGCIEASVLERTRFGLSIAVPIGSEASRLLDDFHVGNIPLSVFQGASATANERAVTALQAVTDKREEQSSVGAIVVKSFGAESAGAFLLADGPSPQAILTSRAEPGDSESLWEEAGRACPPGFDKAASASAVRQVLTRMQPKPNKSQTTAIKSAVARSFTLVQGPPGTGKTVTAAAIVVSAVVGGRGPVLATASSNVAVDNLLEKILHTSSAVRKMRVVRVGRVAAVQEDLWQYTLESMLEMDSAVRRAREIAEKNPSEAAASWQIEQEAARRIVRSADVVLSTCVGAGRDILEHVPFRFLLSDEASQSTEPDVLIPLVVGGGSSVNQMVLVGDHHQLPPTVLSEVKSASGLSCSLFSRVWNVGVSSIMLDLQYRMHPEIAAFPARHFYFGKLKTGVSRDQRPFQVESGAEVDALSTILKKHRVLFLDVPDGADERDGSREFDAAFSFVNREESRVTAAVVEALPYLREEIGVISPYAAQVRLLSRLLRKEGERRVEVSTVDGFQGREKTAIVFSAVRSNPRRQVGFLSDWRRLNVALTRAKSVLVVVGSSQTLRSDKHWASWLQGAHIRLAEDVI